MNRKRRDRVYALRAGAVELVRQGFPVIPLKEGTKQPLWAAWQHKAITEIGRVSAVWESDTYNIGIVTGITHDVLDIDQKNNGLSNYAKLVRAGLIPEAQALVDTANGGYHLYYPSSGDGNHTTSYGIDYRGKGGYVVAPPSILGPEEKPYNFRWTEWDSKSEPLKWPAIISVLSPPPARISNGDAEGIEGLAKWVEKQPEGKRNDALHWAACRAAEENLDPTPLAEAAYRAGLGKEEIVATIRSAMRHGRP